MRKDDRRDIFVRNFSLCNTTKKAVGKAATRSNGHGGELDLSTNITQSKNIVDAGILILIDQNMPVVALFDACFSERETIHGRNTAWSNEDNVGSINHLAIDTGHLLLARGDV
jgi:hypothetical protein